MFLNEKVHCEETFNEESDIGPIATSQRVDPVETLSRMHSMHTSQGGNPMVTTSKNYFFKTARIEAKWKNKMVLLAGNSSKDIGQDIGHLLGIPVNRMVLSNFADGESKVQLQESVRGKHVYVVNSTTSPDSLMELLILIPTLRRASAKSVTVVIPYYGYARQDDRKGSREPVAAADVAIMLEEMGVDHVICMDLHNDSLRGFFSPRCPVDHLIPVPVAAAYFHDAFSSGSGSKKNKKTHGVEDSSLPDITIVASHEGQVYRATYFREIMQEMSGRPVELAVLAKNKIVSGNDKTAYEAKLVGNVKGRKCIIVDDIVNTGGTLVKNIKRLKESGAESIYAWATHAVFGPPKDGDAPSRLQDLEELEYLLVSNSIELDRKLPSKIRLLNVAPVLAEAISRSIHGDSVSKILSPASLGDSERYDG